MGALVLGVVGALLVLIALGDLFLTIFNYDGFSSLANRLHRWLWRAMRTLARPLPDRLRHNALSVGSASMLPATYILWLGLGIIGFALLYEAVLQARPPAFVLHGVGRDLGSALYLSAGGISSLTFGDIVPRTGLTRLLVDLETIIGLTTFTLALGYVVTTFDVLKTLDGLHAIVRRHAEDPGKPSSILARHFRGGQPTELPSLLEAVTDRLEQYDEGLRRYPVVYYFHTRRLERSIPHVFAILGRLVALVRWGLPAEEPMTQDALLAALIDQYDTTLDRLQRSFVGPPALDPPDPLSPSAFASAYADRQLPTDEPRRWVAEFRDLQATARSSAGLGDPPTAGDDASYQQYREWLPFAYRNRVVLDRVADALGYHSPESM